MMLQYINILLQKLCRNSPSAEVGTISRSALGAICLAVMMSTSARAEESLTYLETAGRYVDLKDEIDARLGRGAKPNSTLLSYQCIAYGKLKQYEKLFACASQLERLANRGEFQFDLDQRMMFISSSDARPLPATLSARAYFELAEYGKAMAAANTVLEILSRIPETGGTSLFPTVRYRIAALEVLALSAVRLGDADQATRFAQQIDDVSRPFIGGRMWGWIKDNALGQVYMALGRYEDALKYVPETSIGTKIMVSFVNGVSPYAYRGDSSTTIIEMPRLIMRGKALAETGKVADARAAFDEALSSVRVKDTGDLYWVALFERGRIAEAEKQAEQAAMYYRQAVDIVELQRSSIHTEASKIGFVGDKQAVYARLIDVLIEQGRITEAFDYVERSKSRALVDMLAAKTDFAAPDPQQTRLVLAQLDAAELSSRVPNERAEPEAKSASNRNLQLARHAIQSATPELSSLVTVTSVPSEELKSLVAADETLIEYYYQGKDLYAFILDRERLLAVRLSAGDLASQVHSLRKLLEKPNSSVWQSMAHSLYQRLWRPLEGRIANKNVIVVAHGALHYLPFSALQDEDGKFLIDRYGLRFLPSASVLKFLRPVIQRNEAPLLVLGNPDLDDPALDLAFAEGEAKLVGAMNPKSRVLLRKDASESNFKKAGSIFTRIHFATHGKFQADSPLSSGLYLAKDADNDGMLTVGELYSMKLEADLVTLSACETGLGKIASGDDVVGLTRGFLYAGTRSIVASLWSVDDQATAALMQAFYSNLASMNKREALRQAQIKTRVTFPHPFYWAAFQLTGRAE
jgi:CHAT domain-containing protein